jgi:hypothetical protein
MSTSWDLPVAKPDRQRAATSRSDGRCTTRNIGRCFANTRSSGSGGSWTD